jgi:hypothetical protein
LIAQAMLFLLRNKDRYGVWHSTQATVQVLNAILDATGKESSADATTAEVVVNGRPAVTLALPPSGDVTGPVRADISQFLVPGANRVEVRRSRGGTAQMQIAGAYYVPWQKRMAAEDLKFSVQFDRTAVATGAPVTCRVHAEHANFRGRGMLLAEIGLPPGADVDRQSLDSAGIDHYDILPDRVVMYLWPHRGAADFSFRFRPRFGMLAKTAPSLLYDYYNPGARSVVAPVVFTVSGSKLSTASAADSRPSTRSASASRSAGRAVSTRRNSRTSGS